MKKYEIVYSEESTINKKAIVEAINKVAALAIFVLNNPNAVYETINEIVDD